MVVARSVMRRREPSRMQRLKERHQRGGLRRTQVLSISRHVAAALNHLPDQLILGELDGHSIQLRPALPSRTTQSVAIVALLSLKNQRTLPLQSRTPFEILRWNR